MRKAKINLYSNQEFEAEMSKNESLKFDFQNISCVKFFSKENNGSHQSDSSQRDFGQRECPRDDHKTLSRKDQDNLSRFKISQASKDKFLTNSRKQLTNKVDIRKEVIARISPDFLFDCSSSKETTRNKSNEKKIFTQPFQFSDIKHASSLEKKIFTQPFQFSDIKQASSLFQNPLIQSDVSSNRAPIDNDKHENNETPQLISYFIQSNKKILTGQIDISSRNSPSRMVHNLQQGKERGIEKKSPQIICQRNSYLLESNKFSQHHRSCYKSQRSPVKHLKQENKVGQGQLLSTETNTKKVATNQNNSNSFKCGLGQQAEYSPERTHDNLEISKMTSIQKSDEISKEIAQNQQFKFGKVRSKSSRNIKINECGLKQQEKLDIAMLKINESLHNQQFSGYAQISNLIKKYIVNCEQTNITNIKQQQNDQSLSTKDTHQFKTKIFKIDSQKEQLGKNLSEGVSGTRISQKNHICLYKNQNSDQLPYLELQTPSQKTIPTHQALQDICISSFSIVIPKKSGWMDIQNNQCRGSALEQSSVLYSPQQIINKAEETDRINRKTWKGIGYSQLKSIYNKTPKNMDPDKTFKMIKRLLYKSKDQSPFKNISNHRAAIFSHHNDKV